MGAGMPIVGETLEYAPIKLMLLSPRADPLIGLLAPSLFDL
jgi:hypothetical protein